MIMAELVPTGVSDSVIQSLGSSVSKVIQSITNLQKGWHRVCSARKHQPLRLALKRAEKMEKRR
jgi:hypothetical protein